ncbi:UNVERIFIED_CONTAM: methyltransferase family protein [Acetivibrio alkalicellulosi]
MFNKSEVFVMEMNFKSIILDNKIDMAFLNDLLNKPLPFTPSEKLFWDDPHISKGMLEAHLNPDIDLASRKPETIEKTVKNLIDSMNLKPGDKILDLGCGPGLYCKHFSQLGFKVTGLDYSKRSIEYAKKDALIKALDIEYKYMNYLDMEYLNEFNAIILIFGDLCVLSNKDRDLLLKKIHKALKPDGYFAFDVSTRIHRSKYGIKNRWHISDGGFWRPGLHMVLENGFDYPKENIYLDQYIVIEESGKVSVYRNWFQDYSLEVIVDVLNNCEFKLKTVLSDLTGKSYEKNSEWMGIIAHTI